MKSTAPLLVILMIGLSLATPVRAADSAIPSLEENIPDGVTPDPAERTIILSVAEMVTSLLVGYGEEGQVRSLQISNHGADIPRGSSEEERAALKEKPGLDDAAFASLGKLRGLEALTLRRQFRLSDDSFAVLQNWPNLRVLRIEAHHGTEQFIPHLNHVPELQWLELKHIGSVEGTLIHQLNGFPELIRLELDDAQSEEESLIFLERCPNIRDLEMHRTGLNNEQIGRLVRALPKLVSLELKPAPVNMDAACLEHVKELEHLERFAFVRWPDDAIFWENGVEHLVGMDSLLMVGTGEEQWESHPVIQKLKAARPELTEGRGNDTDFGYFATRR